MEMSETQLALKYKMKFIAHVTESIGLDPGVQTRFLGNQLHSEAGFLCNTRCTSG